MLARTLRGDVAKSAQSVRIEIFLYIKTYLDKFQNKGKAAQSILILLLQRLLYLMLTPAGGNSKRDPTANA